MNQDNGNTDKQLKSKAIKLQGKEYVQVADRIIYFNSTYENGAIQTELLSAPAAEMVVIKATIYPDVSAPDRSFIGHSQAKWGQGMVNRTAALENCETSAVGRALAMMGIGVIDSVASIDEIHKAKEEPTFGKRIDTPQQAQTQTLGNCAKCGAPNKWSEKNQRSYCSAMCWKETT